MRSLSALLPILLAACAIDTDAPDVDNIPKLSSNALLPSQLNYSPLSRDVLNGDTINSVAQSSDGRVFLQYLVGCGLPAGQSITTTVGAVYYTFNGSLGLAPEWTSRGLTVSEERWVSACILARVNEFGVAVSISMRGPFPGLAVTGTEASNYGIEEAAFFGDIFSPTPVMAACNGVDQAARDDYGDLPLRECGEPGTSAGTTACGFQYRDLCSVACTRAPYTDCVDASGNHFAEVITTYLYGHPQ